MAPRLRTQAATDDTVVATPELKEMSSKARFLDRFEHFTWAWFTLPMATGGMSLLLAEQTQPHTFHGLQTIGKIVYIWDLFLFTVVTLCITYRFVRFPGTLVASLTHPTESLFAATPLLSLASIIAAIARYGIPACGPWLLVAYRVLFWVYFLISFAAAVFLYFLLFTSPALKLSDMTPAWDLPIFPFMLCGTIASAGAGAAAAFAGRADDRLGMLMSVLMYANYIHRMIQYGFPSPPSRAGMFIAVGPPSFTALALIGMANDFPTTYYISATVETGLTPDQLAVTGTVLKTVATFSGVFIYALSLWFFCISVLACLAARREMAFRLNWWAFVFPNVGFTIATISIGKMFRSSAVGWVGSAMTLVLIVVYLAVGWCHARAAWRGEILSAGKDEDTYWQERDHKLEKLVEKEVEAEQGNV
ncbi:Malic acid transport protein [Mycena sanguinolenta]|uniref:Malic acid transport protein n=1 Tax=Mycena sanguinolenta TaxID=230812 RepID=A0A8H6ZCE9_9AGAR|nr:Malic acid transport protein [Mycena sanguinolenta]